LSAFLVLIPEIDGLFILTLPAWICLRDAPSDSSETATL